MTTKKSTIQHLPGQAGRRLLMLLLSTIAIAVVAARPPVAAQSRGEQDAPRILCYNAAARSAPACERLADLGAAQDPAWVVETATSGVLPGDLTSFDVLFLDTNTGNSLNGSLAKVRSYIESGGGLFLADPDFGSKIGRGLQAPRSNRTPPGNRSIEFTRAQRLTPALRELQLSEMPTNPATVPLNTLGSGWTVQAKLVEQGNLTLATTGFGNGKILLSPFVVDDAAPDDQYMEKSMYWLLNYFDELFTGDISIDAIEVTQAIQSRDNEVLLVQGKKTFVRVHAKFPLAEDKGQLPLTATLRGTAIVDIGNGSVVETDLSPALSPVNPGGYAFISSNPDRSQLNDSFLFELPASWTEFAKLRLTAHVDPLGALNDPDINNNTNSVVVNFGTAYPLYLKLYSVTYEIGNDVYSVPDFHIDSVESWLRRAYPIADLVVKRQPIYHSESGLPDVDDVNLTLAGFRAIDLIYGANPIRIYYGVVDDSGGFMRGKSAGNYIASGPAGIPPRPDGKWAWDTDGSYADWYAGHEIAHTRGRGHANFCGAENGPSFPNPGGWISPYSSYTIGHYGFDIATREIYGPVTWYDVMTYCDNQWISEFTYEGIYNFLALEALGLDRYQRAEQQAADHLIVIALAGLDGAVGSLQTVMVQSGVAPELEEVNSDWSIALLAAGGTLLAEYPFVPDPPSDTEDDPDPQYLISEMVPWVAGAARVQLRHGGQVLDERVMSGNTPTVAIQPPDLSADTATFEWTAADADDDPLTFTILYSADDGATWQTLAAGLEDTSLTVDQDQLPGGPQSRARVLANDGLLTAEATSAPFAVANSAPEVTILSPATGSTYYTAQPITLEGYATDLEDGVLEGAALVWSSDLDGVLGDSDTITTAELSTGEHDISLTAIDSGGEQTTTTITLVVQSADVEPAAALSVAPGYLVVDVLAGAAPATFVLTTRSQTGDPLPWTVTSAHNWLRVHTEGNPPAGSAAGVTPDNLYLVIDSSGLEPGIYEATLLVVPQGAEAQAIAIKVKATNVGIYLPAIVR